LAFGSSPLAADTITESWKSATKILSPEMVTRQNETWYADCLKAIPMPARAQYRSLCKCLILNDLHRRPGHVRKSLILRRLHKLVAAGAGGVVIWHDICLKYLAQDMLEKTFVNRKIILDKKEERNEDMRS